MMSLSLIVHAIGAVLMVGLYANGAWKRVLKDWRPENDSIRYVVSGFLVLTVVSVGWVYLIGPTPLKPFLVANGLFALALMLGFWARRAHPSME